MNDNCANRMTPTSEVEHITNIQSVSPVTVIVEVNKTMSTCINSIYAGVSLSTHLENKTKIVAKSPDL